MCTSTERIVQSETQTDQCFRDDLSKFEGVSRDALQAISKNYLQQNIEFALTNRFDSDNCSNEQNVLTFNIQCLDGKA